MKSKTVRFQDDMGTNGSKAWVVFYVYYFFVLKMAVVL